MKNKVTVSRAPRLNLVPMVSIQCGTYCCDPRNGEIYYTQNNSFVRIEMSGLFGLATHYWVDAGDCFTKMMVHTFGSFDDVCKWVANGRKLEDLQGDTKSEWVSFLTIPIGTIFSYRASAIVAMKSDYQRAVNMDCNIGNVLMDMEKAGLVWPIGAGDTITIEITE